MYDTSPFRPVIGQEKILCVAMYDTSPCRPVIGQYRIIWVTVDTTYILMVAAILISLHTRAERENKVSSTYDNASVW